MKKKIKVLLLGGTIAYTEKNGGPMVSDISSLALSMTEVADIADIYVEKFRQISSPDFVVDVAVDLAKRINEVLETEHPDGIVVVQGTDVMDEVAFSLHLLVHTDVPIAITGAMRNPDMKGADGPANLLAAIQTVASDNCRGIGVMVVFNDVIMSAGTVRKAHPQSTGAFVSEYPLGYVAEGIPSLRVWPVERPLPWLNLKTDKVRTLPIYAAPLGDDGQLLTKIKELNYPGLVVEGTGGGHCSSRIVPYLLELAKEIPVVLTSRVAVGDLLTNTYGDCPGTEKYLYSRGIICGGMLNARQARLLLIYLLMSECTMDEIKESFRVYSKDYKIKKPL